MVQWQLKSNRKVTGGLLRKHSKKKRYQRGRDFIPTHIGDTKAKKLRVRGGNYKMLALAANIANVSVSGKMQKAKIITVKQNPADSQFVRRNIITRGAVIETDIGLAKVTSRPGQDGIVNAVLVEESRKK